MINAISCEDTRYTESLMGLLEYYEATMERNGLVRRAGEVRSLKLGLILDMLKTINIPDRLKTNLTSALLRAWDMKCKGMTSAQSEEELKAMLCSIAAVRNELLRARNHCGPMTKVKLDAAVMIALPLMPSDLMSDEVPGIQNLLSQIMDYFAAKMES